MSDRTIWFTNRALLAVQSIAPERTMHHETAWNPYPIHALQAPQSRLMAKAAAAARWTVVRTHLALREERCKHVERVSGCSDVSAIQDEGLPPAQPFECVYKCREDKAGRIPGPFS